MKKINIKYNYDENKENSYFVEFSLELPNNILHSFSE